MTPSPGRLLLVVGLPALGLVAGYLVYRDANRRGRRELAPLFGVVIAGLVVAGSVPGLVALAVASDPTVQGFPTAIRIVPGLVALSAYVRFR